jgi:hypothetical protein
MNKNVLDNINELFSNPESLRPEMLNSLVLDLFALFNELKTKMASEDEQERSEAVLAANELKTKLEDQAYQLCLSAGIDTTALEEYMNNPSHFSKEEWNAMNAARDTFKELSKQKEEEV